MKSEVVQVELISGDYSWVIPALALLISIGTLAWTRIDRYRDRARVEVKATSFSYLDGFGRDVHQVAAVVTNVGRQGSTVVDTVKFKVGTKGGYLLAWAMPQYSAPFPKRLEPGESAKFIFERIPLCRYMATSKVEPKDFVVIAVTGHGETQGKFDEAALSFITPEVENIKSRTEEQRP